MSFRRKTLKNLAIHLFWLVPLLAFVVAFFTLFGEHFPLVGHDYIFVLPRLIAGKWHFLRQGFFPFRFSSHFCAGFPQYGNPQDMFYSLPQLLILFLEPWAAVQGTLFLSLLAGYVGWYRFGRDVLRLIAPWAHVMALMVLANGFYLVHMIAGHLMFHTIPLIGVLLWLLVRPGRASILATIASGAGCAMIVATMLYSGGFQVVMIALLSCAIVFLFTVLMAPWHRTRVTIFRVVASSVFVVLLCGSKIVAVWSLMRFFPRVYPFDHIAPEASVLLFIFRAFFTFPVREETFSFIRLSWPVSEYTFFLSPMVMLGFLTIPLALWQFRRTILRLWCRSLLVVFATVFLSLFFLQLVRGWGFLVTPLETLPVIRSVHVVVRFLYPLAIAVTCVVVWSLDSLLHRHRLFSPVFAWVLNGTTVVFFFLAYVGIVQTNAFWMQVPLNELREAVQRHDAYDRSVAQVLPGGHSLTLVQDGVTTIQCHEPLFGYSGDLQITTVRPGPVTDVMEGAFNLHHPVCFQYPELYGCKPGDRIPVWDRDNFERFVRGERTTWRVSTLQTASDFVSLATILLCLVILSHTAFARAGSVFRSSRNADSRGAEDRVVPSAHSSAARST